MRLLVGKLFSPQGRRVAVRAPPQTPGFSGQLWRWPDACDFLSPSASSHSVSAFFHSLSFGSLPVTVAYTQPGPLDMATKNKQTNTHINEMSTVIILHYSKSHGFEKENWVLLLTCTGFPSHTTFAVVHSFFSTHHRCLFISKKYLVLTVSTVVMFVVSHFIL